MAKDYGLVDITVLSWFETDKAYGVKVEEDEFGKDAEVIFLPKSRTENNGDNSFTIPLSLVEEKGLTDYIS